MSLSLGFDDDEGEFGGNVGGSKLSSLFGMDKANNQGGNESLTFTAPKQPKKGGKDSSVGGNKSSLLLAVAVHAYRFSNGTYIKHGKLGAAILGNHSASDYKILLYISKMQQVTHVRLTPQFLFTIQPNNYATFYDEQRQNWSIMFESEQNAMDFAKQVALAKLNSGGGVTSSVIQQDLTVGKGDAVVTGDSVEVKYTGWLYQSKMFGDVFDSNANVDKPFRFKIGKGKVIKGWEEGVTGMKKGGRRLLVIPPSHAYGKKGLSSRIPPNSTLIFDVEIKKIKLSRDKEDGESMSSDAAEMAKSSDEMMTSPRMKNGTESPRVDSRSQSENEPMSPTTSSKAKLISRMAKMGQPMLPMSGATVATDNSTDSEADEASASSDTGGPPTPSSLPSSRKPIKTPRKHLPNPAPPSQLPSHQDQISSQPHQLAIYQSQPQYPDQMQQQQQQQPQQPMVVNQPPMGINQPPMQFQQQPVQANVMFGQQNHQGHMAQHPPIGQQLAAPVGFQTQMAPTTMYPGALMQPATSDVQSTLVLSEARQHHSDLRQAVIQVSDKINNISQKIDTLHANQMHAANSGSNAPNMEANILMQNIQRIMQENDRLKKDVYEKSSKIETQNDKISELLQRNQMFVEESNSLLEKRNDTYKQTAAQSQLRVLELEQEKVKLTTDLSNATAKLSSLQLELGQVQQREADVRSKLSTIVTSAEDQQSEVDILKVQSRDAEKKVENLSRLLKEEKQVKKQLEGRLSNLEEEMADLKAEKEAVEKNLSDRRKKAAAEKQRSQDEMEEMKRSYEEELSSLKTRLRQQKSSTDAATAEQVSQIEKELEVQFKERSERIINQAKDTYQREIRDVRDEKEQLARKLAATEQKLLTYRSSQGDSKQQVDDLKEKLEESQAWKEKYDALHSNAVTMKEKYERRIKELLIQEKSAAPVPPPPPPQPESTPNVVDEVKKVMNNVYHSLKSEFESGQSYKGTEILATIMNTIKVTTIRLVQQQSSQEEDEEEEEETEESEDEEDEDTEEEQISPEVEEPVQASASSPELAPPTQHKDSIPDLPEVDQSSQEGESQQGEVPEDDGEDEEKEEEEEEKAEGDGDWDEDNTRQEEIGGIHNENPESDGNVNDDGLEAAGSLSSDPVVSVPDLPDVDLSSETVEADSQPFGQDNDAAEEEIVEEERRPTEEADPQMMREDSKTEDIQQQQGAESTQQGAESQSEDVQEAEKGEEDLFPASEDSKTEDSQSMKQEAASQPSGEDPEPSKEEEEEMDSKEEDDKVEVEQAEGTSGSADPLAVPIMTRDPPDMPPELPPDLPANDDDDEDEEPEEDRKVEQRGLFGDDSDSDGDFFDAVPPSRKKKETPSPSQEEDEESLKPKPPPPLFGDSDDDDDWMN
ncbi:FK506-binding protein 15-like [Apostichopus japonicus]|uniref:FK506-binding protein 15-like n=1 Tax=Stichopus japonicus TaxID=307972 RepID=UPI003AB8F6D5